MTTSLLFPLFLCCFSTTAVEAELGLEGYCPVAIVEDRQWKRGALNIRFHLDGFEYRFSSDEARSKFVANIDRYCPVLHGRCVTCLADHNRDVRGRVKFGAFFDKRLYLFPTAQSREIFKAHRTRYQSVDLWKDGMCPVAQYEGAKESGKVKYTWMFHGYRVRMASQSALEEFKQSPDKFLEFVRN